MIARVQPLQLVVHVSLPYRFSILILADTVIYVSRGVYALTSAIICVVCAVH